MGPRVGSEVSKTGVFKAFRTRNRSTSNRVCVVVPAPSNPSKTIHFPRMVPHFRPIGRFFPLKELYQEHWIDRRVRSAHQGTIRHVFGARSAPYDLNRSSTPVRGSAILVRASTAQVPARPAKPRKAFRLRKIPFRGRFSPRKEQCEKPKIKLEKSA